LTDFETCGEKAVRSGEKMMTFNQFLWH